MPAIQLREPAMVHKVDDTIATVWRYTARALSAKRKDQSRHRTEFSDGS